jgi:integrase
VVVEELSHRRHPEYEKQTIRLTSPTIADFIMIFLFTGLRSDEAASLEWKNVNLQDAYFTIHDTKLSALIGCAPMA